MLRKSFLSGCAALVLGGLAVESVAVAAWRAGGEGAIYVSNVNDDGSHLTFDLDMDANIGGIRHNGSMMVNRPVHIVSEDPRPDNGGDLHGSTNGNIYSWYAGAGSTKGIPYTIKLAY